MRMPLVLVIVALGALAAGCGRSAREIAPHAPAFELVRLAGAKIQVAAKTRLEEASREGAPVIWHDRLAYDVKWLDQLADELERQGAYGPPRNDQADELQRIGSEIRQATECDPALIRALMPTLQDLERTAKQLRVFSLPPDETRAPVPIASR